MTLRNWSRSAVPLVAGQLGLVIIGDDEHVILIHPTEDAYYTRVAEPGESNRFMRVVFHNQAFEDVQAEYWPDMVMQMLAEAQRHLVAT